MNETRSVIYKYLEPIGAGSFGEVWRALRWKAGAPVGSPIAIKLSFQSFDSEQVQTQLQALERIRGLEHPNLLELLGYGEASGRLWIAMELAEGNLWDRLRQYRQRGVFFPPDELVAYMGEGAEALDYLHSRRLLHGGIKPDDILLVAGKAKIADFDLVHCVPGSFPAGRWLQSCATADCMAPEAKAGESNLQSDQYSLASAYGWLRLEHPISSIDFRLEDLAPLPNREQKVILKAMAKEPSHRFESCVDFAHALEEATRRP